jgi:hypothetical protein
MDMGRRKSAYFDSNGKFIKLSAREASITVVMDLVKDPALPLTQTKKENPKRKREKGKHGKRRHKQKIQQPSITNFFKLPSA